MNGRGRRNKGLSGERELANLLFGHIKTLYKKYSLDPSYMLHPNLKVLYHNGVMRNTVQSQLGGSDIDSIPYLLIEVKRCETLSIPAWWRQVCKASRDFNYRNKDSRLSDPIGGVVKMPCVAYRQNRKKWRFIVPAKTFLLGDSKLTFLKESDDMMEVSMECFLAFVTTLFIRPVDVKMLKGDPALIGG